jgi:hypothetical protein
VGQAIGRAYLGAPVGPALADLVALADRRNLALRLALDLDHVPPKMADLPWESVTVPGMMTPLALSPRVRIYRHAALGPTAQPAIPGPLRILAVIASPDHSGVELLDYEHELGTILDQVENARRNDAYVRILNWGSVGAIREALTRERFHILHISCRAVRGLLVLEKPDGTPDRVDAATFVRELVLPGRGVPLVVLAGCDTARASAIDRHTLPGFGRTLLEGGVPAVLAMTSSVGDLYATDLLAGTYGELARSPDAADPLAALSDARRQIESRRAQLAPADPRANLADWAAPALFTRVGRPGPVRSGGTPGRDCPAPARPGRPGHRGSRPGRVRRAQGGAALAHPGDAGAVPPGGCHSRHRRCGQEQPGRPARADARQRPAHGGVPAWPPGRRRYLLGDREAAQGEPAARRRR